jgi:hypothetical protein
VNPENPSALLSALVELLSGSNPENLVQSNRLFPEAVTEASFMKDDFLKIDDGNW